MDFNVQAIHKHDDGRYFMFGEWDDGEIEMYEVEFLPDRGKVIDDTGRRRGEWGPVHDFPARTPETQFKISSDVVRTIPYPWLEPGDY